MQAQQHDDLSTMPAANLKSGRVQTMYEGNDPEEQNNNTPEETSEINEMEVLLRESATPITIKRGDVVEGVIVRIDQDEILVDIGLKSEGVLSTKELPANGYGSYNELLQARVIDYNKGGLIVDVAGIRGFVPISQILNLKREEVAAGGESQETAAKLASMRDKELQLKIIEINRTRNRLILSERLAVQEWRQRRRE